MSKEDFIAWMRELIEGSHDPGDPATAVVGDFVPLVEKSVRSDGTVPIRLIAPGWGASGYYSPDIIKRDGPAAFPKGTKMFWDHPTLTEEAERPERSLTSLAAALGSTPTYLETGPAGPGLYSDAKVFESYRSAVDQMAPYIGTSIRTDGIGKRGSAEGREGIIVEKIMPAKASTSVDFVTSPGAGGQILQLFEAARGSRQDPPPARENENMGEEATKLLEAQTALAEANRQRDEAVAKATTAETEKARLETDNRRLTEVNILREAGELALAEVTKVEGIPDITKTRLVEQLSTNPPTKDGKLDVDAFKTKILEAVKAEAKYLAELTGSGKIVGMGTTDSSGMLSEADVTKELEKAFTGLGLSESVAKQAAAGRSN